MRVEGTGRLMDRQAMRPSQATDGPQGETVGAA